MPTISDHEKLSDESCVTISPECHQLITVTQQHRPTASSKERRRDREHEIETSDASGSCVV